MNNENKTTEKMNKKEFAKKYAPVLIGGVIMIGELLVIAYEVGFRKGLKKGYPAGVKNGVLLAASASYADRDAAEMIFFNGIERACDSEQMRRSVIDLGHDFIANNKELINL